MQLCLITTQYKTTDMGAKFSAAENTQNCSRRKLDLQQHMPFQILHHLWTLIVSSHLWKNILTWWFYAHLCQHRCWFYALLKTNCMVLLIFHLEDGMDINNKKVNEKFWMIILINCGYLTVKGAIEIKLFTRSQDSF